MSDGYSEQGVSFLDESGRDGNFGVNLELPPVRNEMPFSEHVGDFVGKGRESVVWNLGPDWVIKNVNIYNQFGDRRSAEQLVKMRSKELVKIYNKEQQWLEDVFGKENFRRQFFVYGKDLTRKEGYFMVQKKVHGELLVKNDVEVTKSDEERVILENREEFKKILWGVKKTIIEYGLPGDFHLGNLMKEASTGRLVLVDFGSPFVESELVFNDNRYESKSPYLLENAIKRVERLKRLELLMNLSNEEVMVLNKHFSISDEDFKKKLSVLEGRVVEIEKIGKAVQKSQNINAFLDNVFGGSEDEISGSEMIRKIEVFLQQEKDNKNLINLIDKVKVQNVRRGNKEFWGQLLTSLF